MKRINLPALLFLASQECLAQTVITGDAWITQGLQVGTTVPGARLEVAASSTTGTVFQVSDVTGIPIMTVSGAGKLGFGVAPSGNLDINGSADDSSIGLQLTSGNLYPSTSSVQVAFGYNGTTNLSHAIRTIHSSAAASNSIDFALWSTNVSSTSIGTLKVLSLVTISSSPSSREASFHVMPVDVSTVEATVSNGATLGGGTVHRAAEISHSSRELKAEIAYLGHEDEKVAYEAVQGLKHAEFRYKVRKKGQLVRDRKQPLRRGLIYEDAPEDIKGPGNSLVLDQRVNLSELALKELMRRLEAAESAARELER